MPTPTTTKRAMYPRRQMYALLLDAPKPSAWARMRELLANLWARRREALR